MFRVWKRVGPAIVVGWAIGVAGCVSSEYMAVGETTYAPRAPDYIIDIYLPADAPVDVQREIALNRPVEELRADAEVIGRVDTRGGSLSDWSSLLRDAQDKARQLGGDAVVVRQLWSR